MPKRPKETEMVPSERSERATMLSQRGDETLGEREMLRQASERFYQLAKRCFRSQGCIALEGMHEGRKQW